MYFGKNKFIRFVVFLFYLFVFSPESFGNDENKLRIISLSPNLTSIIISLGCEDNLVGITRYCKINSKDKKIEIIGDFLSPNFEKILSLKPDLVFLLSSQKTDEEKLNKLGIKTISSGNNTMAEIKESILQIGKALNKEKEAKELIKKIDDALSKYENLHNEIKPKVIFVVGRQKDDLSQIYAAAKGSFLDELITAAGGENVVEKAINLYPIISKESLLKMNPDIILDSSLGENLSQKEKEEQIKIWEKLSTIKAVKEKKVFFVSDPNITIPGPHIPESIEALAEIIHQK